MRFATALALLITMTTTLATAAEPDARTIRSTGTATVYAKPDEVEIRFTVHTFDRALEAAKRANDVACAEMLKLVKALNVEDKDIQTDAMSAVQVYEESVRDKPREFKGYTVKREYSVVLRDVSKFESLTDLLLKRTDCTIGSHTFRSSQSRKFRDEARRSAVRAAREKAELMAGELKCGVGAPRQISEQETSFGSVRQNTWSNFNRDDNAGGDAGDGSGVAQLGQIALTASVEVVFDLVPAQN